MSVPRDAHVNTFYGFMDRFLISRGHKLAYERIGERSFWEDVQERVIGEAIGPEWKFDALIVDEGQDFEPQWSEILRLFLTKLHRVSSPLKVTAPTTPAALARSGVKIRFKPGP